MNRLQWLMRYAETPEEKAALERLKQKMTAERKKAFEEANRRGTGRARKRNRPRE